MKTEDITLTIYNAIKPHKKRSERIIGYVPYMLVYDVYTCDGESKKPEKISILEKTIVHLINKGINSLSEIASNLGLDISDDLEFKMLDTAMRKLSNVFQLVYSNRAGHFLTNSGLQYIDEGIVVKTFSKPFRISATPVSLSFPHMHKVIGKGISAQPLKHPDTKLDLEQIQHLANYQASYMHSSEQGLQLIKAEIVEARRFQYKVYVAFVQSIRDNSIRTIVYDNQREIVVPLLSDLFDNNQSLTEPLFKSCIEKGLSTNDVIAVESGEKSFEQIETENKIIEEADTLGEKVDDYRNYERTSKVGKIFDSIEFEEELQNIFESHQNDEIWLISPWIKNYAFIGTREPQIRRFLDQGGAVFIGYSESENPDEVMVDPKSMEVVERLHRIYDKFYYMELPKFHMKNVIEKKGDDVSLYTGSFNVLSFCISGNQEHYRMEQMTFANKTEAEERRKQYLLQFAEEYIKQYLEAIKLAESKTNIDFSKLTYLQETGEFAEAMKDIELSAKEAKLNTSSLTRPSDVMLLELSKKIIVSPYSSDAYPLQMRLAAILFLFEYAKDKQEQSLIDYSMKSLFEILSRNSIYSTCRFTMGPGKVDNKKTILNIICNNLSFEFSEISLPQNTFKTISKYKEYIKFKENNIKSVKVCISEVLYNTAKSIGFYNITEV